MRFLHTADWHVGKTLRGRNRADEHVAVLAEIVRIGEEKKVDAVFIVGDLFDSSAPTPESERIVYNALLELAKVTPQVVIISGNHDNSMRFEAIKPLLRLTNIHVLATPSRPSEGGVISFKNDQGETVNLALLPFLSQRSIIRADQLISGSAADHALEYAERAKRVIEALCQDFSTKSINILLSHAMVQGGLLGGGERLAHTIFEYSIPTSAFPPILHYVALGHLHRAQKLAGACPIWYSGSPISLDFSETKDIKSVSIVDAQAGKPAKVEQIPIKSGRRLRVISGTIDDLIAMKDTLGDDLLRVDLIASDTAGVSDQVREILPNALDVRLVRKNPTAQPKNTINTSRSPQELFAQYLKEQDDDDKGVKKLFNELLDEIHATDPS
ncbi:MAG: exonuclease SbcCD subunit D [Cyclobacteriaceae bacterium]|nr:exonuclease SbcCD subunit D [Cyclobacteriaceae bacterium]